jgi:hypothetical protein
MQAMSLGGKPISFRCLSVRSWKPAGDPCRHRFRNARQYSRSKLRTLRVDSTGGPVPSFSGKTSLGAAMEVSRGASAKALPVASFTEAAARWSLAASRPVSDVRWVCWGGIGCSCCCAGREHGQTKGPVRCRRGLVKRSRRRILAHDSFHGPARAGYVFTVRGAHDVDHEASLPRISPKIKGCVGAARIL